jgi:hypothetical protein
MTRQEKCEAIIQKIAELVDSGQVVRFEEDWGRWTATVCVGAAHTHVGIPEPDGTFDLFVDNLYNSLTGGPGLSWVTSQQED